MVRWFWRHLKATPLWACPLQVNTSACGSWGSASRRRPAAAWPSAPTLASPTAASRWARRRTWTPTARPSCRRSEPCGCGGEGAWPSPRGGARACRAAPTRCWRSPTRSTRTSRTATTVGPPYKFVFMLFYFIFLFFFFYFINFSTFPKLKFSLNFFFF